MNDPEFVEISVKDSGIGIKEEDIPHLFDSDKLARKQGTDRENGSGLGLSLCKDSLEKLGGYIEVLSRVNEGSEFIVYLKRS